MDNTYCLGNMLFLVIFVAGSMYILSSAQPTIKLNDWMTSHQNEIYTSCEKRIQTSLDFILVELQRQTYENIQLREEISELRNLTIEQTEFIESWTENVTHLFMNLNGSHESLDNAISVETKFVQEFAENITRLWQFSNPTKQCHCKENIAETLATDETDVIVEDGFDTFGHQSEQLDISYDEVIEPPAVPTTEAQMVTTEKYEEQTYPEDCTAVYEEMALSNSTMETAVYKIKPNTSESPFMVWCDVADDKVWTVIQTRRDGSVDFYRNWKDYKQGFGDMDSGEFWLGNEKIFQITNQANYMLRIEMWDWHQTDQNPDGNHYYTESNFFKLDNETNFYNLLVPDDFYAYSGYGGSGLRVHAGPFITYDVQPSDVRGNCAEKFHCGWWFSTCVRNANLNGRYYEGGFVNVPTRTRAIDDIYWPNIDQSLREVVMKISRHE